MINNSFNILLLTGLTILSLFSCNTPDNEKYIVLDIEKAINNKTEIKLSDIAESVEWIKLAADNAPFVGIISKIIRTDNYLIILGTESVGTKDRIHIFDINGKHIRTLGEFGKGPCEYMQISDISYDPLDKKILALSENNKYFIEFDIDGNCFENKIETKGAMNFCKDNECLYMHRNSNALYFSNNTIFNQLVIYNTEDGTSKSMHRAPKIKSTYLNPFIENAVLLNLDETILYYIPLDDTIYQVNPNKEVPYIVFEHGKYSFPTDFTWDIENRNKANKMNKSKITNMMAVGRTLFFNYRFADQQGLLLWNKEKLINCYGNKQPGITDDIDGTDNILIFNGSGEYLVQTFEPYELLEMQSNKYGFSNEFRKIIAEINENSSVVIRMIKIKSDAVQQ